MEMTWFCVASQKKIKMMVGHLVGVCRRKGLKVNADMTKVMVLQREEGLEHKFCVNGTQLE